MECNRCLRAFRPVEEAQKGMKPDWDEDTPMGGMPDYEPKNYNSAKNEGMAWECRCGLYVCGGCRSRAESD
jgi:hypothetical protein